jgi:hypothetical protein
MSAPVARTWLALQEAKIRPLPDQTPLRQVLKALRDATRGKAGWADGVDFRVVHEALLEAEITLDAPVSLPFAGRPEVPVDLYLKYLLREFGWERYVVGVTVVIDSPCDDCVGNGTVGAAEAHTWLLFHEVVPIDLARETSLGDFITAIAGATVGKGQEGRGLVIYPQPDALRAKAITLRTPVAIDTRRVELGDLLRTSLKPLGLAPRVLPDGTVMLIERAQGGVRGTWNDAFPEYRFSYSFVWEEWAKALQEAGRARRESKPAREAARP